MLVCGYNECFQLGIGHRFDKNRPEPTRDEDIVSVCCGEYYTLILKVDGTLYRHGIFYTNRPYESNKSGQVDKDKEIEMICGGRCHVFIKKRNREIYGAGMNNRGQLGLGD